MKTVVILGSGNVAFHLTRAFIENTIHVRQIFSRNLEQAKLIGEANKISFTNKISEIEKADLYIITASDSSIEEVSYHIPYENALVVHTSGSMPMETLKGKFRKGVLYPLQTFTKKRKLEYGKIPFFIETQNKEDYESLKKLINKISIYVYYLNSEERLKLQMSAVFTCNFVNYLYSVAEDICKEINIPFSCLKPLIHETAEKINYISPTEAQTGPAKRADKVVIEKHLKTIKDDKLNLIYDSITKKILKKYHG